MHNDDTNELTPAQSRLLATIREAPEPVTVEGPRRYRLGDEKLHHATVSALVRRGLLRDAGDTLVLVDSREDVSTDEPPEEVANGAEPGRPLEDVRRDDLARILRDPETVNTTTRHAEIRRFEDAGRDDPATRAREAIRATRNRSGRPTPSRDESVFGWFWRRLEGLLS